MLSLTGMLCRFWRGALCGLTRKEPQEETAEEAPGENKADDLTVIRGTKIERWIAQTRELAGKVTT